MKLYKSDRKIHKQQILNLLVFCSLVFIEHQNIHYMCGLTLIVSKMLSIRRDFTTQITSYPM